jgi:2-dehydropantoate 2-reductase
VPRSPSSPGRDSWGSTSTDAAPPRTLVVGPGAIGGYVAARLTDAGWPVSVVARGATLEALRDRPLRVTDGGVEGEVRLRVVADPAEAGEVDLALVCVKSFDTEGAARAVRPALARGAVVLSLQNGVGNPAVIARECPDAAVGGVAVYLGCQRLAPDHVVRRPSRDPSTGRLRDLLAGGGAGAPGAALAAVGAAVGVPVRVDDDPAAALWTKLVANVCLNTVTALGRARVGRVFAEPAAVELMLALGREVVAVARAAGVPVAPDAAEAYIADARRRLPRDGGSSTLFDLENGRRLERDALVGAVVREGARLGVPVPVSRACDALLRLNEAPSA